MTDIVNPTDDQLRACCASEEWLGRMAAARPFPSASAAGDLSDEIMRDLPDGALEQALATHARIGERRLGDTAEDRRSRDEQAGALDGDTDVQQRLAEGNHRYEERFGHLFLIRAAGRSAEEMLAALEQRLGNDVKAERDVVRAELAEIVRLRLLALAEAG